MKTNWALAIALAFLTSCSRPAEQKSTSAPAASSTTPAGVCDVNTTPPPDSNFPKGFDYPQNVQPWVQSRKGHLIRTHSWCLFAGLHQQSQPNGPFVWQNWKTSTQAFPYQYNPWLAKSGEPVPKRPSPINARNLANASTEGNNPINNPPPVYPINSAVAAKYPQCREPIANHPNWFQLKDGARMQSNGDIMVAGVVYNDAAIKNILSTQLYNAAYLNTKLPVMNLAPPVAIPEFPSSSIVLKPMFWPVQKDGFTALPVWDWDANKPGGPADGQYAGYEMQKFWTNAVAITANPSAPAPSSIQYLHGVYDPKGQNPIGPVTYPSSAFRVVGINDFYHRQMNQTELGQLSDCDRALLDASAYWAYNRAFQPGDYLALVAMHIITKEQPDWTFQSAWYHPAANSANCGRFCGDRPTNLKDTTFQHYYMTSTYGQIQQKGNSNYYAPPTTKGPVWPVAYNPYIELAASHPITTNCMNCHHRAAWPPFDTVNKPDLKRASTYLQANPPNPNALEVFEESDKNLFHGLVTLDSMWAVSDRAGFPAK